MSHTLKSSYQPLSSTNTRLQDPATQGPPEKVRDVVFDEDRHQLRTGKAPQLMATLRNTTISLLRLAGHTKIATALRHHGRSTSRPVDLLLTA